MKKLLLVVVLAGLFFSCKKNEILSLNNQIAGKWELEKFIGLPTYYLPPGNGKIIVIGKDGSFQRLQHDTVVFSGSYTLQQKDDCNQRSSQIAFFTNESTSGNYTCVELQDGELTFSTPICYADGGTAYFRRLQ